MTGAWEWDGSDPEIVDPSAITGPGETPELPPDAVTRFAFGQVIELECTECGARFGIIIEPDGDLPDDASGSRELAVTCDDCGATAWLTLVLTAPE